MHQIENSRRITANFQVSKGQFEELFQHVNFTITSQPNKVTSQKTNGVKPKQDGVFSSYFFEQGKGKFWKCGGPH
jgi:hypothetical protein